MRLILLAPVAVLATLPLVLSACSSSDAGTTSDGALTQTSNDHWFYDGPLPALDDVEVTVSLAGQTVRVGGHLPADVTVNPSDVPHAKLKADGDRTRIDVVYPIATARPGKHNSDPGSDYGIVNGKLFRPDGQAVTKEEGVHYVTWGGFPFIPYNGGIALHGPISSVEPGEAPQVEPDGTEPDPTKVWYLKRAQVSGGCNRMMGEHVLEVANLLGFNMHAVHTHDAFYDRPGGKAPVTVVADYDTYDGQLIDVDYPTYDCQQGEACAPMQRPVADPANNVRVVMFGSWVASTSGGAGDLPANGRWEAGIPGHAYDFSDPKHARSGWVCALPSSQLKSKSGMIAPQGFCGAPSTDALRATGH